MEKIFFISFILSASWASAQEKPAASAEELAKKLANPVANLISFPLQNYTDYGIGPYNGSRNTLNIQTVVPIKLSPKLNLITRYILPVVTQNDVTGDGKKESGLSDLLATAFFAPSDTKNGFIWACNKNNLNNRSTPEKNVKKIFRMTFQFYHQSNLRNEKAIHYIKYSSSCYHTFFLRFKKETSGS